MERVASLKPWKLALSAPIAARPVARRASRSANSLESDPDSPNTDLRSGASFTCAIFSANAICGRL